MSRYEINDAGDEVKDNETGLIWARCSVGQEWNGETCSGKPLLMDYNNAIEYSQKQAGWRMPTIRELESILDRSSSPAIDTTVFTGTQYQWCWSASLYDEGFYDAWCVNLRDGYVSYDHRDYDYAVRLVKRFVISERGDEVLDTTTGLTWARCSVGQVWDGETCSGEVKEMQYDEAMGYAASQDGWRLPTKDELVSLVDKNYKPMIDNVAFPGTRTRIGWYWSSSPYAGYSSFACYVSFSFGYVYNGNRYHYSGAVRLVKAGE